MDIPRLDAKSVSVELVNDAIKHAFLVLGYTAATSDQDKAIREFLQQGRDVFRVISVLCRFARCI